jgi:hypothetical protein
MTSHHLEVRPLSRHNWIVQYEGDPAPLAAELPTQAEARAEARNFARQYGEPVIHVHELDGECHTEEVEPDFRAPTPRDAKGPHVEP